jgi:hypothetical protein
VCQTLSVDKEVMKLCHLDREIYVTRRSPQSQAYLASPYLERGIVAVQCRQNWHSLQLAEGKAERFCGASRAVHQHCKL